MIPKNKKIALPLTIEDLDPTDREQVEAFTFFLSVAGKCGDTTFPLWKRQIACNWLDGLITPDEGKRLLKAGKNG